MWHRSWMYSRTVCRVKGGECEIVVQRCHARLYAPTRELQNIQDRHAD